MKLNHEDTGAGRAIIVLHGLFGSLTNWKGIARKLADEFRVISVDLRNHGRSPWDDDVSYPAMADDVAELMDDLDLEDALLVGHSMGGKVAMTLALEQPQRVAALAVIDIAPVAYDHTHEALIATLQSVDLSSIRKRSDLDEQLSEEIPDASLRAFLGQNLVFDDGAYRWRIHLDALGRGMSLLTAFPTFEESRYEGDCVFVHGQASDYVAVEHHDAIKARFPHATFIGVPDAGHWVHAERPERIIAAVRALALSP